MKLSNISKGSSMVGAQIKQEREEKKNAHFSSSKELLGLACLGRGKGHRVATMMHKLKLYLTLKSRLEIWRLEVCV